MTDTLSPDDLLDDDTTGFASAEDLLEGAKSDIREDVVRDVFDGKKVKIRALTAAQNAMVNQGSITIGGGRRGKNTDFNFATSEKMKFRYGVAEPKLTPDQVQMLHFTAGPSFQAVLKAIDEISGIKEKDVEDAEEAFPGPIE